MNCRHEKCGAAPDNFVVEREALFLDSACKSESEIAQMVKQTRSWLYGKAQRVTATVYSEVC